MIKNIQVFEEFAQEYDEWDDFKICQTIFRTLYEINSIKPVKNGYGEGGFVAIKARKGSEKIV